MRSSLQRWPTKDYRSYSYWLDSVDDDLSPRPPLTSDLDVDVAVVGAGYTGLWTAYFLAHAQPDLRIAVLEREIAGFGASGRNGGWCSALFPKGKDAMARRHGRAGTVALQRALFDTVDEVGRVAEAEGIDIHYAKGGTLTLATEPAHVERLKHEVEHERSWGFSEHDYRWLEGDEVAGRVDVDGCLGAAYTPHCAAIHPARLVRGLARAVERAGVKIYEQTPVQAIDGREASSEGGRVRAEVVVRAIEGYTPQLRGAHRALLPIYSLMIATEPLPSSFWDQVGWSGRETFTDGRHLIIYAQRTADGRIAMGGRGAPYHFGSRIEDDYDHEQHVFEHLHEALRALFPALGDAHVTHRWGGVLGAPRDWQASVGFDPSSGSAWAGGYVGDGVGTSNLAGRTLADLILGRATELVTLPWVNHRSRSWEPEPLRWLGANLARVAMASADRAESRRGRPSRRAELCKRLLGMP